MLTQSLNPVRKRTLRKVHSQFLRKRYENKNAEVDPDTRFLSKESSVFRLGSSLVLAEENRKLRCGTEYLNIGFKILDYLVENGPLNKIVSVNLQAGCPEQYISWDYAAKRLRSYGDLDLATWADRIDNFYKIFGKVLSDVEKSLTKSSLNTEDFWEECRSRSQEACKQIEKKFDKFARIDYRLTRDEISIIFGCFSEGLYKALGYTDESIIDLVQSYGMPPIFEGDSAVYFNLVKYMLDLGGFKGNLISQFPEEKSNILLCDGSKKKATARSFHVFEPTPKGFISHYYIVITNINDNVCEDSEDEFHHMYSKCSKSIQALTIE